MPQVSQGLVAGVMCRLHVLLLCELYHYCDMYRRPAQVVSWKDFNLRSDEHIRETIKRSNVVVNLIGAERETWNYSFEDVHIDAAKRIAQAAAENPMTERFVHVSCLGAKEDAASRRLRTKVRRCCHAHKSCQRQAAGRACGWREGIR